MRKLLFLLIIAVLFSCTNPIKKNKSLKVAIPKSQSTTPQKTAMLNGDEKDSVNISTDDSDVSIVSKSDLKRILKKDPELNNDNPYPPDICWGKSLKNDIEFDCEACRDYYYALYAYFLRSKNGDAKYQRQRKTLIELYRDIDALFGRLNGGGTYYGHQYTRILGYAEWSVYNYKENSYLIKSYNITTQKELYVRLLKQYMDDEVNKDPELAQREKDKKIIELFKKISDIKSLITTSFYLSMAQKFQILIIEI